MTTVLLRSFTARVRIQSANCRCFSLFILFEKQDYNKLLRTKNVFGEQGFLTTKRGFKKQPKGSHKTMHDGESKQFRLDALHYTLFALFIIFFSFDVLWCTRSIHQILKSLFMHKESTSNENCESGKANSDNDAKLSRVLKKTSYMGMCFTQDLDLLIHMNNSRYLREMDFARFKHLGLTGIGPSVAKEKGRMVVAASTIRYRKSVMLGHIYNIESKLITWDKDSLYLEQRLVTRDGMVRAIGHFKLHVSFPKPMTLELFMKEYFKDEITIPVAPPYLKSWMDYNTMSSDVLRSERVTDEACQTGFDNAGNVVK